MQEATLTRLTIDPEFRDLIRPLDPYERDLLEQSLKGNNILDSPEPFR